MSYIELFTKISRDRIADCAAYVAEDIRFQDPFNDLRGRTAFQALLHKTLDDVASPAFEVIDEAHSDRGVHYLRWIFTGHVKGLGLWRIEGMSELHYNADGKVCLHIDHWDAGGQFYEKLPILRWILKKIRMRLRID